MNGDRYAPLRPEHIKVLILTEQKLHYSCVLRGTMPLEHLKRKGLARYGHQPFSPESPRLVEDIMDSDVLVIFSLADSRWHEFVKYAREKLGKVVIADFDDDLWDVCPGNFAYEHLGRHEVPVKIVHAGTKKEEMRMWWHDGRDGFQAQANRMLVNRISGMARNCTALSVANRRLEDHMLYYNSDVEVLGNCVDLDLWHTNRMNYPGGRIRIGWQGGDSHRRDMMYHGEQIGRFLHDHPEVDFILCGTFIPELRNWVDPKRVEFHPWVTSETYPYMMMTLGLDIGIAPLEDTRFNRRKTALKWMEYSAMGVPTLASDVAPYADEIHDGEDGILVEKGGWHEALERAVRSRLELRAMGIRARHRMERDFDIRERCMDWYRFYRRLIDEKGERRLLPARAIGGLGGRQFRSNWFSVQKAV